jgi:protein gp37
MNVTKHDQAMKQDKTAKHDQAMKQDKYKNGFILTMHNNVLDEPIKWKKPHTIFVCSMSIVDETEQ